MSVEKIYYNRIKELEQENNQLKEGQRIRDKNLLNELRENSFLQKKLEKIEEVLRRDDVELEYIVPRSFKIKLKKILSEQKINEVKT